MAEDGVAVLCRRCRLPWYLAVWVEARKREIRESMAEGERAGEAIVAFAVGQGATGVTKRGMCACYGEEVRSQALEVEERELRRWRGEGR